MLFSFIVLVTCVSLNAAVHEITDQNMRDTAAALHTRFIQNAYAHVDGADFVRCISTENTIANHIRTTLKPRMVGYFAENNVVGFAAFKQEPLDSSEWAQYYSYDPESEVPHVQILQLAVHPLYEHPHDINKKLVAAILALMPDTQSVSMTAGTHNTVAQSFARALGFKRSGCPREPYLSHSAQPVQATPSNDLYPYKNIPVAQNGPRTQSHDFIGYAIAVADLQRALQN